VNLSPHEFAIDVLIEHALQARLKLGECFEIALSDDGLCTLIGRRKTREFLYEWGSCFLDSERKPRKDRKYLAVSWSEGGYLIEL
jgi:hypothetical protein